MCNGLLTGTIKSKGENIMNYTPNHHLPQWVSSDRVRMSDFNAAMANIEPGLSANAATVSQS